MRLQWLEVADLRCIERAVLEPEPGLNVIAGSNGAGKTAVLEAINVLGTGRSFRAGGLRELTRWGADSLSVRGRLYGRDGPTIISVARGSGEAQIAIDRRPVRSAAALARALPLVVLDVGSAELVEGGPKARRRWLDTTLFHVEQGYLDLWLGYHRALRQRNAALIAGTVDSSGTPFDHLLVKEAEALTDMRHRLFAWLAQWAEDRALSLLDHPLQLQYRRGWAEGPDFATVLRDRLQADRQLGSTLLGPHRADVVIRSRERAVRHHVSRGQGKLAASLLLLAQAACLTDLRGEAPLLLVDDLASELDAVARERMVTFLRDTGSQVFLTTTDRALLPSSGIARLFHVEQGRVTG